MPKLSANSATRGGLLLALLIIAVAFPQVLTNPATVNYGVYAMIFVTVASAWGIFSGNSGYISIGHAVFFGSGAYALGIMAHAWNVSPVGTFALLPLVAVVGAVIAAIVGIIALRVRRHTFIVITIGIFFIFQLMATNFGFTGGSNGLSPPFLPWSNAEVTTNFYYMALAAAVAAVAIAVVIRRSRFGLQLRAIRDDEDRARGLGVKTMRVKLASLVISGTITALIGAIWFYFVGNVQPDTGYDPLFDLLVVLMAFLGGYGTVAGPVLGALIIEPGQLWLYTKSSNNYLSEIILGGVFLVFVLFVPRGIIPTGTEWITRLRTRGRPAVVTAVATATSGSVPPEPPSSEKVGAAQ